MCDLSPILWLYGFVPIRKGWNRVVTCDGHGCDSVSVSTHGGSEIGSRLGEPYQAAEKVERHREMPGVPGKYVKDQLLTAFSLQPSAFSFDAVAWLRRGG
jgi:hypothetical protein